MGKMVTAVNEAQVSNDVDFSRQQPFAVKVRIKGTRDILFHAWNTEDVEAKADAKKGSEDKKRDNLEAYIYRNDEGLICIPGRYIVRAIVEAGRSYQDPRSKKKMAKELVQASVMSDEIMSPILVNGKPTDTWEYEDRQRVTIMRSGITRTRPAFKAGWEVEFTLISLVPDLITPEFLRKLVDHAGLLIGLADFRPTYGRFKVVHWEIMPYVNADAI